MSEAATTEVQPETDTTDSRDVILQELAGLDEDKPQEPNEAEAQEDDTAQEQESTESDDTGAEAEAKTETDDTAVDTERDRRIAAIKDEEKASRSRIDELYASKDRELSEKWQPLIEEAKSWESVKGQGVVAVLEHLGYTGERLEEAARAAYAASPAGLKHPQLRQNAEQLQARRQQDEKLSATEKRIQELEQRLHNEAVERETP